MNNREINDSKDSHSAFNDSAFRDTGSSRSIPKMPYVYKTNSNIRVLKKKFTLHSSCQELDDFINEMTDSAPEPIVPVFFETIHLKNPFFTYSSKSARAIPTKESRIHKFDTSTGKSNTSRIGRREENYFIKETDSEKSDAGKTCSGPSKKRSSKFSSAGKEESADSVKKVKGKNVKFEKKMTVKLINHEGDESGFEIVTNSQKSFANLKYYVQAMKSVVLVNGRGLSKDYCLRVQQHLVINYNQLSEVYSTYKTTKPTNIPKEVEIPDYDPSKKVLIFDLDETLVHVNRGATFKKSGHFVKVKKPSGQTVTVGFTVRPFSRELLQTLKPLFNLVLMTASVRAYAEKVKEVLDPDDNIFQLFLTKESCLYLKGGKSIKNLSIYKGINPKDLILVDNFASAYALHPQNGVPVLPFYGVSTKGDQELKFLLDFLEELKEVEDVRPVINRCFGTRLILDSKTIQEYLAKLRVSFEAH